MGLGTAGRAAVRGHPSPPPLAAILRALRSAVSPQDLDMPGWRLHPLSGDRKDFWSVKVCWHWRIIFRFVDGDARDVDLVDYH